MTIFPFQPNPSGPFQFQPTLDGNTYNVSVPWMLFGKRYYVLCQDLNGNIIFEQGMAGSPTGTPIQTASWGGNQVQVITASPHKFRTGQTVRITIAGCSPAAYNGTYIALVTSPLTLVYTLAGDPGDLLVPGQVEQNINLAGPYFKTSTLVFRQDAQQFEVNP